jgi:hypothetical protein
MIDYLAEALESDSHSFGEERLVTALRTLGETARKQGWLASPKRV